MNRINKVNGSILIIALILLIPVTLIATTMIHEVKNQWMISRNQITQLKNTFELEEWIDKFIHQPHEMNNLNVTATATLQYTKESSCRRSKLGNSTNVIDQCNEKTYLIHDVKNGIDKYVLLQETLLYR